MSETIQTIIEWHTATFPDTDFKAQEQKYQDEFKEFSNTSWGTQDELDELADLVIVCCGIMRFDFPQGWEYLVHTIKHLLTTNHSSGALWVAVENKMKKNRMRVWNKTETGTYQHKAGILD